MVYSMYDRMVVGGAMPCGEVLKLEAIDPLKQPIFLRSREMGMYNVGGPGIVTVGETKFELNFKEALYLGSGDREVTFESKDAKLILLNSTSTHLQLTETILIRRSQKMMQLLPKWVLLEGSNHRNINKMIVNQVSAYLSNSNGYD